MEHLLKSWANTLRFLIILFVVCAVILKIINVVTASTEFQLDFSNEKTLITVVDKKNIVTNAVLAACDCWVYTGIEIRPDEGYEIKVSGKIHTSFDKITRDAESDRIPDFRWIGPGGDNVFRLRTDAQYRLSDSIRKTLLISQQANLGQVLFYFQQQDSPQPNCDIGLGFYNPDSVFRYDHVKGLKGTNATEETYYVWATVNDMLLRDLSQTSNRIAYEGGATGVKLANKVNEWKRLAEANYNRVWFDDNFGQFVISAKIEKPVPVFGWW